MARPQRNNSLRRFFSGLLGMLLILGFGWGVGLFIYADTIPSHVEDVEPSADAIVVLTGGSGRLSAGLKLLAEKRAKKLFVSGVYKGVDVKRLLTLYQNAPAELACCVEIGEDAANTEGNAIETAAWIKKQNYKSLIIVTSNYHMPRSLLEFRYAMPTAEFSPHSVLPVTFKRDRWWAWPGTAGLLMREYNKYLLVWIRHAGQKLLQNN